MMTWALECLKAADALYGRELDPPLLAAREAGENWRLGLCPPGVPIKAAREVHRFARTLETPLEQAVARAFGHAAATAHMADHALGVPIYLAKARKLAGMPSEPGRAEECARLAALPPALAEGILTELTDKEQPKVRRKKD